MRIRRCYTANYREARETLSHKIVWYCTALSTIAALFAAIFSAWTAWETHQSVDQSNRATRAAIWMSLLNEYNSPEMLAAMKALRDLQTNDPGGFATAFGDLKMKLNKSMEEVKKLEKIDSDRRRVAQFFNKLRILAELKILEERELWINWGKSTLTFLTQVVIPLERAKIDALYKSGNLTESNYRNSQTEMDIKEVFYQRVFGDRLER